MWMLSYFEEFICTKEEIVTWRLVSLKKRDWCILISWCLALGIGVSSRSLSMKICKSRLVPTSVCTSGDWCLQISVRVVWCLPWFVPMRIGVSSRLATKNICYSRLVPTNNYKENFCGFHPKEFPHKSCVPCSVVNRSHMWFFSYGWWMFEKVKNCIILIHPPSQYNCVLNTNHLPITCSTIWTPFSLT
jgi:hypothetical protein